MSARRDRSLGLVLPEGKASDDAFTLAHGETNMRLRGERRPAFEEVRASDRIEAPPSDRPRRRRRRVRVSAHFTYRDRRGRFVSRRRWSRSHGRGGRYVRVRVKSYSYLRAAGGEGVHRTPRHALDGGSILPPLPRHRGPFDRGPFDTLAEAGDAFVAVTHGDPLSGPALDRRLRALGLDPLTLTIQGAFSDQQGGPLTLWEHSGPAIGGLTLATYPGLLDQLTRDWRNDNASPPVILVSRLGVAPLDASP